MRNICYFVNMLTKCACVERIFSGYNLIKKDFLSKNQLEIDAIEAIIRVKEYLANDGVSSFTQNI